MRSPITSLLAAALLPCAGCILLPGEPWALAGPELVVALPVDEGRLTPEGRIATAKSYAIELRELAVEVESVTIRQAPLEGAGPTTFDPASPPPGYSLCHGGHCHSDDGRLVDYAEIEAELAGGAAGGSSLVILAAEEAVLLEPGGSALVPLSPCAEACWLERGRLASFDALVTGLRMSGVVHDRLEGEARRLPDEGVPFAAFIPFDEPFRAPLQGSVARGEPRKVVVDASLHLPVTMFDPLEVADLVEPGEPLVLDPSVLPAAVEAVVEIIREDAVFQAAVSRPREEERP